MRARGGAWPACAEHAKITLKTTDYGVDDVPAQTDARECDGYLPLWDEFDLLREGEYSKVCAKKWFKFPVRRTLLYPTPLKGFV